MRDATRGGVATVLNEIANDSKVSIIIKEDSLPVRTPTVEEYTENWHCLCIFTYICNRINIYMGISP
jgi:thiamine monophosphate kinase